MAGLHYWQLPGGGGGGGLHVSKIMSKSGLSSDRTVNEHRNVQEKVEVSGWCGLGYYTTVVRLHVVRWNERDSRESRQLVGQSGRSTWLRLQRLVRSAAVCDQCEQHQLRQTYPRPLRQHPECKPGHFWTNVAVWRHHLLESRDSSTNTSRNIYNTIVV